MKKVNLFVFVFFSFLMANTQAQTTMGQAQAIFVYNFTRLIEWPNKEGDFVIGNMGSADFESSLEKFVSGKKVGSQNIIVKKFKNISEIESCNIIVVSASNNGKIQEIMSKVGRNHTLVVTEKRGAIDSGSAINFVLKDDKLKFELKSANAARQGLKVSSKLESMAIMVD